MQTYLQKQTLERLGINYFDAWAADFGETVTALELAPSGKGYRARTRFAKFTNLPELLTLYHSFADVKTDVKLEVPGSGAESRNDKADGYGYRTDGTDCRARRQNIRRRCRSAYRQYAQSHGRRQETRPRSEMYRSDDGGRERQQTQLLRGERV